tara:strand:- start:1178 stop:1525 length:348 start_codon:yes stop_codon:yes gene_type:complete
MLNLSLNNVIDLSTAATFGFLSMSGLMAGTKCSKKSCVCVPTADGKSCVCVPVDECSSKDKSCELDDKSCCVDGETMKCVKSDCPVSPCSRANFKLAVATGAVTSALYLYRGVTN